MKHSRIVFILGTNAELIKIFPLMLELQKRKLDYWFIHTGQHSLKNYCELFGIKEPDFILNKEAKKNLKFWSKINFRTFLWNLKTMFRIRGIIRKLKPKFVVYHGDTMNTAMALGASSIILNPFAKKWKNVHLEGGLRSGTIREPLPEEFIRRIVFLFSDFSLTPSELSKKNLEESFSFVEGKSIHFGNTVLDSVDTALKISERMKIKRFKDKRYVLISIHRYENLKNEARMRKIIELIEFFDIPVYWPLHENTKKKLDNLGLLERLERNRNIILTEPLDYPTFIYHLKNSSLIFCDGGSMQEESLIFEKPCIIMRNTTERPEGLKTNFQFLSKFRVEETKIKIKEFLSSDFKVIKSKNPYGEKGLSKKIVDFLLR